MIIFIDFLDDWGVLEEKIKVVFLLFLLKKKYLVKISDD